MNFSARSVIISFFAHAGVTNKIAESIAYDAEHVDIKTMLVEMAYDCMKAKFIKSVSKLDVSVMDSLRGAAGVRRSSVHPIVLDPQIKASFENREGPDSLYALIDVIRDRFNINVDEIRPVESVKREREVKEDETNAKKLDASTKRAKVVTPVADTRYTLSDKTRTKSTSQSRTTRAVADQRGIVVLPVRDQIRTTRVDGVDEKPKKQKKTIDDADRFKAPKPLKRAKKPIEEKSASLKLIYVEDYTKVFLVENSNTFFVVVPKAHSNNPSLHPDLLRQRYKDNPDVNAIQKYVHAIAKSVRDPNVLPSDRKLQALEQQRQQKLSI